MTKILHNPIFLLATGLFFFMGAMIVGILLIRKMRHQVITPTLDESRRGAESNAFALAAYDAVIRKMKDQEKELEQLRRTDRERAAESASISEAVLSNLPSG